MARVVINQEALKKATRQSKRVKIIRPMLDVEWTGVFEGWSRNYVRRNFWRVSQHFGSQDDAVHQCLVIFYRCKRRYEFTTDNPRWFMSLFKTAVTNHFTIQSIKESGLRDMPVDADLPTAQNDGPFLAALAGCSNEAQQVVNLLMNAPSELLKVVWQDDAPPGAPIAAVKRIFGIAGSLSSIKAELKRLIS